MKPPRQKWSNMKINRETPRTEMVYASILDKMSEFYVALADELGFSVDTVEKHLTEYAALSARAEFKKGEIDFDLADVKDTPDEVKAKFIKYMDTEKIEVVKAALVEMARALIATVASIRGPEPLPEDAPKA